MVTGKILPFFKPHMVAIPKCLNCFRLSLRPNIRISGTIPNIRVDKADLKESSFVSDCGVPTEFDDPLACISCTMCCEFKYTFLSGVFVQSAYHDSHMS